jgi:hypothetical protein
MLGSLRERLERRQRLQQRIDQLVGGTVPPGSKDTDTDPVVSCDMEAAIAEAFHREQNKRSYAPRRRGNSE